MGSCDSAIVVTARYRGSHVRKPDSLMTSQHDKAKRRFSFGLMRLLFAVTVIGAPLAAMNGNGVGGLFVAMIFAIPLAGLAMMVPP